MAHPYRTFRFVSNRIFVVTGPVKLVLTRALGRVRMGQTCGKESYRSVKKDSKAMVAGTAEGVSATFEIEVRKVKGIRDAVAERRGVEDIVQ